MVVQNTNIGYTVFGVLDELSFNSISLLDIKVYVSKNEILKKQMWVFGHKTERGGSCASEYADGGAMAEGL